MKNDAAIGSAIQHLTLWVGLVIFLAVPCALSQDFGSDPQMDPGKGCSQSQHGSPYISVDSWVYPAVLRLYSMGFIDHVYLGMRPWTRASLLHMLEDADIQLDDPDSDRTSTVDEAREIQKALIDWLNPNAGSPCPAHQGDAVIESTYTVVRAMSGTPLRDSYHLGSTIINDYGRPYQSGVSNYTGASGYAAEGRFVLHLRGEFQGAPSAVGYSSALAQTLSTIDGTTYANSLGIPYVQSTIPMGPIVSTTKGRFIEAYVSASYLNHEFSFGKQDDWSGPAVGGSMAYSNNAENIYTFRINRVEPLRIPLLSELTGPFRYDFLVGPLRGHTYMPSLTPGVPGSANVVNPGNPWVHVEKISFRPTANLEFGFERTVLWGGEGHSPVTFKSFLRSFFSLASPKNGAVKNGPTDPGARFGTFDFSYRLPFFRNWLTLYTDSEVHDDVSPIDAPRRASWRPGIYLSHFPGIPKLDIRLEAADTDVSNSNILSHYGRFSYWEQIEKQGYTNQGQIFGDWMGREDKGGQAWMTYHLRGNEWLQIGLRNQKAANYFVPGGTTLNDISFQAVKRLGKDFEINGQFVFERWKAPIYLVGQQTVPNTTIRLSWFPEKKIRF